MSARDIKDLSIALEALSRINRPGSDQLYNRVERALDKALRSPISQEVRKPKHPDTEIEDEIPF